MFAALRRGPEPDVPHRRPCRSDAPLGSWRGARGREGGEAHLCLIETKGEGGYALVPGCPPAPDAIIQGILTAVAAAAKA